MRLLVILFLLYNLNVYNLQMSEISVDFTITYLLLGICDIISTSIKVSDITRLSPSTDLMNGSRSKAQQYGRERILLYKKET